MLGATDILVPMSERPLECSECKRPIAVRYTELANGSCLETVMCSECPVLHRRLHGAAATAMEGADQEITGLCCGSCGTTLESIRTGNPLGCSECYEVFQTVIAEGLQHAGLLAMPKRRLGGRKHHHHIGRSPEESVQISPSLRLLALNEALDETLSQEDYEQAAWLRDQIKAITERSDAE